MARSDRRDHVDWICGQWRRERADLAVAPIATWGRLKRLSNLSDRIVSAQLKPFRLTLGEFDVLAALRRSGAPFQMSPSELSDALIVSAGTTTNRIGRLERRGLIARLPQPEDGRGILVTLTESGRELFDGAFAVVVAVLEEAVQPIAAEQEALATILRKLLLPYDGHAGFFLPRVSHESNGVAGSEE